ncbi:MAG: sialate O-acetylesterase [Bacteroidales bacterium]|nr:sialate O-acetylesterase [Bacteroidales bacterium]
MKKLLTLSLLILLAAAGLQAKVTLPSVFADHMVLQQQKDVAFWGTADAGRKVTIRPSWTKYKYVTETESDGSWFILIPTPAAGGPYSITFSDGREKTVLNDVLLGEVWYCSGQSNMEMTLKGYTGQPVEGATDVILSAKPSLPLRICNVKRRVSVTEEKDCSCEWALNTPGTVSSTSAVAYFFGLKLQEVLGVPVGLVISAKSGSPIEAWMNRETLSREFKGEFDYAHLDTGVLPSRKPHRTPCVLYNGQVAGLVPFTFRGMIWYQGENNVGRAEQYVRLQQSFVRMMRYLFKCPDAPFYYVQIAPYIYATEAPMASAYLREAQEAALSLIPRSGMVCTLDIAERDGTVHPCKKREVGNRLAYLALQDEYGYDSIEARSPAFVSAEFKDGAATVTLSHSEGGLAPLDREVGGFELAGEDRVFHGATARIQRNSTILVSSPEVPEPVAVRYCFSNWCEGSVFNVFGIPAYPFRSDRW